MGGNRFINWAILLHPTEDLTSGKTGVFDATVVIDSDPWIGPHLSNLVHMESCPTKTFGQILIMCWWPSTGKHPKDWAFKAWEVASTLFGAVEPHTT